MMSLQKTSPKNSKRYGIERRDFLKYMAVIGDSVAACHRQGRWKSSPSCGLPVQARSRLGRSGTGWGGVVDAVGTATLDGWRHATFANPHPLGVATDGAFKNIVRHGRAGPAAAGTLCSCGGDRA